MKNIDDRIEQVLNEMLKTFKMKNVQYGSNYIAVGEVMKALFPYGIHLNSEYDFIRYHWVDWCVGKLTRFVNSGMTDRDSILDLAVYAAMITALVDHHDRKE